MFVPWSCGSGVKRMRENMRARGGVYSRITSSKSLSFCTTNFSASLTHLTVPLLQSRDYSCYVSRPSTGTSAVRTAKDTLFYVHTTSRALPALWRLPMLTKDACAWSWRLYGINPAILAMRIVLGNILSSERRSSLISCSYPSAGKLVRRR